MWGVSHTETNLSLYEPASCLSCPHRVWQGCDAYQYTHGPPQGRRAPTNQGNQPIPSAEEPPAGQALLSAHAHTHNQPSHPLLRRMETALKQQLRGSLYHFRFAASKASQAGQCDLEAQVTLPRFQ